MLGQDAAKALAIARTAELVFDDSDSTPMSSWVWPQAVATATAAATLAKLMDANAEQAHTAGLLSNLWVVMGEKHDAEHPGKAADVLESWNFPESIANAVRNHHRSLDDVVSPLDRAVLCARTFAAEAGFPDVRPVPRCATCSAPPRSGKMQSKGIAAEVERALGSLVRLAGTR